MAANLDFCRRCEAAYTSSEGDMGMCPPCNDQSEGIAEQLREAEDLRDELDELDARQEADEEADYLHGMRAFEDEDCNEDCDGNPPFMDNHHPVG